MSSDTGASRPMPNHVAAAVATALLGASAFVVPAGPATADTFHQSIDGIAIVEAESGAVPPNWLAKDELPDYLGDSYLLNVGPNPSPNSQDVMRYRITIAEPGFYEFRLRSRIGEGEDYKEHNDSWLRLPTGKNIPGEEPLDGWTKVYMNRLGTWTWDTATVDFAPRPIRQYLDAGDHLVEIAGRSSSHAIDRFALYDYDAHDFSTSRFDALAPSPISDVPTGHGGNTEPPLRADTPDDFMPVGECRFGRLVLEPLADVDVAGGDVVDDATLDANASGRRALLRFDLANVPNVNIARLRTTAAAPIAAERRDFWLGDATAWTEDSPAAELPDALVLLGSDAEAYEAEERIDTSLSSSLIEAPSLTVIVETVGAEAVELRAREADAGRPRLVLKGDAQFCADYVANGGAGDAGEEEGDTGDGDADSDGGDGEDAGVDTGADTGINTGGDTGRDTGGDASGDAGDHDAGDTGGDAGGDGSDGADDDAGDGNATGADGDATGADGEDVGADGATGGDTRIDEGSDSGDTTGGAADAGDSGNDDGAGSGSGSDAGGTDERTSQKRARSGGGGFGPGLFALLGVLLGRGVMRRRPR